MFPVLKGYVNSETADNVLKHGDKSEKVLGLEWDDHNDKLVFNVCELFKDVVNIQPTKRNILSIISTTYDPAGYLQPITIQLRKTL